MNHENLSFNPNFICADSITWFREFILLQDETPSVLIEKKEDSLFLKNQIIQVKIEEPKPAEKSVFSSHLLHSPKVLPQEKMITNPSWIHGFIIICFLLFAIAQYSYFKRMQQIFKAFFANRLFNQLSRDGGLFRERVSLFLFGSFLLSFSIFIFKIYDFYFDIPVTGFISFIIFLKILIVVILFYLLKMGLFNLSGFIFKSPKETSDYILTIYIFGQVTGILLLPVIVLVTYLQSEANIYFGLALLSIFYLYRLFRGIAIITSNIKISVYYLFLYLCALEILPLFILAKILMVHIS